MSFQRSRIIQSNLGTHRKEAPIYDVIHPEIFNFYEQRRIHRDVDFILSHMKRDKPTVLDIGCGTGNLTLKFLTRNFTVTALDLSPDMLHVLQQKACYAPLTIVNSDVDSFLLNSDRSYDVIACSSILHHLPDYKDTLTLALSCLNKHGILYITHEPFNSLSDNYIANHISSISSRFNSLKLFKYRFTIMNIDYTISDYHCCSDILSDILEIIEPKSRILKHELYRSEKSGLAAFINNVLLKAAPNTFTLIVQSM